MEDFEIRELDFSFLDSLIEAEAPKNGCTTAGSGVCCPRIHK